MPRRSTAALSIAHVGPGLRRLEPPPDMTEGSLERRLFLETVSSVVAHHFAAEDSSSRIREDGRPSAASERGAGGLCHGGRSSEPMAGGSYRRGTQPRSVGDAIAAGTEGAAAERPAPASDRTGTTECL
jgi:hypothetical protein